MMNMRSLIGVLVVCTSVLLGTHETYPQSSTTNYRFAEPNEFTIVVNLLGSVSRPGRYEISRSIDLPNLLSLAGGTSPEARLDNIKITRSVKVGTNIDRKEITVNLERLIKAAEADLLLYQGDFIYVDHGSSLTYGDVLSFLTTAAILTTTTITIINQTKK